VCYLPGVSSLPARLSDLDLRAPAYIPNEQRKAVGITARRCIDERCYDRYLGDIVHVFTNRCPLLTIPFGNDLPTVYQTLLREREYIRVLIEADQWTIDSFVRQWFPFPVRIVFCIV
jgi:hypothetical protein